MVHYETRHDIWSSMWRSTLHHAVHILTVLYNDIVKSIIEPQLMTMQYMSTDVMLSKSQPTPSIRIRPSSDSPTST